MPTLRFFVLTGLLVTMLAASLVADWLQAAVLAGDALLVMAFFADYLRARRARVAASRRLPPLMAQRARCRVEVELCNEGGRTLKLELREGLHPAVASRPCRLRLRLKPGESKVWTYDVTPRRRGEHALAPLHTRIRGPWGLARSQRELIAAETHRVYPQVRWEGRVGQLLHLAQRRELGRMPIRFAGGGSELYAVREYWPGDPLNRVCWKASARHGRLISREDSWERGHRLVILLDSARAMSARSGRRSKLDHALAASLALVRVAVARGDRITIIAFADRIERIVRVGSGSRGVVRAYGALYDLRSRRVEPAYDAAAEQALQAEGRRSTVVMFTSVVDLAAVELLRTALRDLGRRHYPLLVNLEDPELHQLAYSAPSSVEESFAKVSGLEILLANRRLAREFRRHGVRTVTTPADRLALETLNGYLAMVERRRAA